MKGSLSSRLVRWRRYYRPRTTTDCPSLRQSVLISDTKLPSDLIMWWVRRTEGWGLEGGGAEVVVLVVGGVGGGGGWCGIWANVQACWRQGGVLITGCMHFVKCRAINLGNYPRPPAPHRHNVLPTPPPNSLPPMSPYVCLSPSSSITQTNFPGGPVGALSHGNEGTRPSDPALPSAPDVLAWTIKNIKAANFKK